MDYMQAMAHYKQKNATKLDDTANLVKKRSVALWQGDYKLAHIYLKQIKALWSSTRDHAHIQRTIMSIS